MIQGGAKLAKPEVFHENSDGPRLSLTDDFPPNNLIAARIVSICGLAASICPRNFASLLIALCSVLGYLPKQFFIFPPA